MKITPLEIRQQRFHVKFRGFDPEEVDTFLEMVANEFEALIQAGDLTKKEFDSLREEYQAFRLENQRLRKALEEAEQAKAQAQEKLRAEAAEIRARANQEAKAILEAARRERVEAQQAVVSLTEQRRQIVGRLRELLESQMRLLESMEETEPLSQAHRKPSR